MTRFFFLAAMAFTLSFGCTANVAKGEKLANDWAAANFPNSTVNNVQCQGVDSDGDGYISCNVSLTNNKTGVTSVPPLECSGGHTQGCSGHNGCRAPKAARGW